MTTLNQETAPTPPRILTFDALRILAIALVVLIHALMTSRGIATQPPSFARVDKMIHFAMPLFVFVSGVFVWGKPWGNRRYGSFVKQKAQRLLPSYFFWCALYLSLLFSGFAGSGALYGGEYNWNGLPTAGPDLLTTLMRIPGYILTGHGWYHLYFIPMIFTFYLFTPLIWRACKRWRYAPEALLAISIIIKAALWSPLKAGLDMVGAPFLTSAITHLVMNFPYMMAGAWLMMRLGNPIKQHAAKIAAQTSVRREVAPHKSAQVTSTKGEREEPGEMLGLMGLGGSASSWINAVYYLPMIGLLTGVAIALEGLWARMAKVVTGLSRLSFGVYYLHPLFLAIIMRYVRVFGDESWEQLWTSWPFVLGVWAAMLICSYLTSWLLSKTKKTAWMVGE